MNGVLIRFALAIVLVIGSTLGLAARAAAQSVPQGHPAEAQSIDLSAAPSTDELKALVRTLETPEARARLIGELRALVAARGEESPATAAAPAKASQPTMGAAALALISGRIHRIGAGVAALSSLAQWSALPEWARRLASDPALRLRWIEGLAVVFGVIALALMVERACEALLRAPRRSYGAARRGAGRLASFLVEIALRWAPLLAFAATGYGLLAAWMALRESEPAARAATLSIIDAHTLANAVIAMAAAALAPAPGVAGIARLDEETANYWLVWISRLTRLAAYAYFALAFAVGMEADPAAVALLAQLAGLAFVGLLVMLVLQNRAAVARALRGRDPRDPQRILPRIRMRVAENWHWVAIVCLLAGYGVWASRAPGFYLFVARATALSAIVVAAAGLVTIAGVDLAGRLLTISPEMAQRLPGLQKRVNRYAPVFVGIGRTAVNLVALALIVQIWGLDPIGWLATAPGLRLLEDLGVILLSIAISLAVWELAGLFIDIYLSRPGADGTLIERSARMRTLLPLARRTLAVALGAVVLLVFLAEIGINIGPLLAGAGIAGLTIGLGAQSLVKDVINGMFILAQDAVAVGDVVTVAGCSGLVEELSIRSVRLRALDGTVIVVPFSEIGTVKNLTKDFSYALFDIGVSYREDVDEVVKIVTAVADELRADPDYAWRILEPIEVLGLDQFADSAVIIKARIKTRPIQQWNVLREYNRRLKRRFDELGVEIPFPHRTLYFGVDKQGAAPPARVLAEFTGETPPTKAKASRRR